MRWRFLAIVSLGVNLLLAAGWVYSAHHQAAGKGVPPDGGKEGVSQPGGTNVVYRRLSFSWHEVESDDYATYIANLRDIGCPEQTIRDIIIADVNALYARRRSTEVLTPFQQWWRSQPDAALAELALAKVRALEEERRGLLTKLLGLTWETGDLVNLPRPSRTGVALDGPVLGTLSVEVKQALQDINLRSQERVEAYLEAQRKAGKSADPVELVRFRKETRAELAGVLSPPQLEEYLLRYSQYASNLRAEFGTLQFFEPSPDEFRAVFRATDELDQRIQLLAGSADPESVQARRTLEEQRENALKVALGQKRYEDYRLLHDPVYRQSMAQAQEAGTPEAVGAIYAINLAAAGEQQVIQSNATFTAEQKNIALKSLQLDQLKASTIATGGELPPDPASAPAPAPRRIYTLRPGDSAAVVAMIYGVPESAIRAANPGVDFNRLKPGASINIPRSGLTPGPAPTMIPMMPPFPPGALNP